MSTTLPADVPDTLVRLSPLQRIRRLDTPALTDQAQWRAEAHALRAEVAQWRALAQEWEGELRAVAAELARLRAAGA